MRFYVTERLGPTRSKTPEGFLLVMGVPIGRTGDMIYGPNEVPVTPGADGLVRVERTADEVFKDITIASFNGKPITLDHPAGPVTPDNWRDHAVGTVINPRKGINGHSDCIVADLLITRQDAIDAVENQGLKEVSCGYDSEYLEIAPGHGRQQNIIGNHLALVPQGRCGPRCAIGDHATQTPVENITMKLSDIIARVKAAIATKDDAKINAALTEAEKNAATADDGGDEHTHIHVHGSTEAPTVDDEPSPAVGSEGEAAPAWFLEHVASNNARFDALEAMMNGGGAGGEEEVMDDATAEQLVEETSDEEMTEEKAKETKDSAILSGSFQQVVAAAEILSPGIRIPTFDSAAKPKATLDSICQLRRSALQAAYATQDGFAFIDQARAGKKLDLPKMSCDAVRTLFQSAVAWRKAANNAAHFTPRQTATTKDGGAEQHAGRPVTVADINKRNADFWSKRNSTQH